MGAQQVHLHHDAQSEGCVTSLEFMLNCERPASDPLFMAFFCLPALQFLHAKDTTDCILVFTCFHLCFCERNAIVILKLCVAECCSSLQYRYLGHSHATGDTTYNRSWKH